MKRSIITVITLSFLMFNLLSIQVLAQEKPRNTSELTIPWDEFKKLINLDADEIIISLETFQRLLAQTGVTTTPQHTLRGGNVVLKRAEFKNKTYREGLKQYSDKMKRS